MIEKGKVNDCLAAFAHNGTVATTFMNSLLGAFAYDAQQPYRRLTEYHDAIGPYIHDNRSRIARYFLECTDKQWLWFLDNDMQFEPDTLRRMLQAAEQYDTRILGAAYWNKYTATNIYLSWLLFTPDGIRAVDHLPDQEAPIEVTAVGMGCCPPGTKIKTATGWANIADVRVGDEVLTHTGDVAAVTATMQREYSGEIIQITPKKLGRQVELTPEHPVYVVEAKRYGHGIRKPNSAFRKWEYGEPEWVEAGDLTQDHILLYKIDERIEDLQTIRLSHTLVNVEFQEGGRIAYPNHNSNRVLNEVSVDHRLMRLLGYYLADGEANHNGVKFNFALHEQRYVDDVTEIVRELFGLDLGEAERNEKKKILRLAVNSKVLGQWFEHECGRSSEKHAPVWTMLLPKEKQEQLLLGYLRGDGHFWGHRATGISSNSISWLLTTQLREMYLRCGLIPSVGGTRNANGYRPGSLRYNLTLVGEPARAFLERLEPDFVCSWERKKAQGGQAWIDRGYVWMPIHRLTRRQYDGYVYNFQVGGRPAVAAEVRTTELAIAGSGPSPSFSSFRMETAPNWGSQNGDASFGGSYITEGFVVHNCTLIHRDVLQDVSDMHPNDPWDTFAADILYRFEDGGFLMARSPDDAEEQIKSRPLKGYERCGEDVTFTLRARKAGYLTYGLPTVIAEHHKALQMPHGNPPESVPRAALEADPHGP